MEHDKVKLFADPLPESRSPCTRHSEFGADRIDSMALPGRPVHRMPRSPLPIPGSRHRPRHRQGRMLEAGRGMKTDAVTARYQPERPEPHKVATASPRSIARRRPLRERGSHRRKSCRWARPTCGNRPPAGPVPIGSFGRSCLAESRLPSCLSFGQPMACSGAALPFTASLRVPSSPEFTARPDRPVSARSASRGCSHRCVSDRPNPTSGVTVNRPAVTPGARSRA